MHNTSMRVIDPHKILAKRITAAGSQVKAAAELGISPAYLTDILYGRRAISSSVALKLGLERAMVFVKSKSLARLRTQG